MKFGKVFLINLFSIIILSLLFTNCNKQINSNFSEQETIEYYKTQLKTKELNSIQKFSILKKMADSLNANKQYNELILLLTDWIETNPDDIYNSYWLLMTAHAYLSLNSEPIAEYYFDKILSNYPDLYIQDKSIHLICLQNLVQISKTPSHKIKYFNDLIKRFPNNINKTELHLRLALEYEKDTLWDKAIESYNSFLEEPDSTTIQIPGETDAYKKARRIVSLNKSSKDWTFESLQELESSIKKAIRNYDAATLDKYRAKVDFFTMSWKQDEIDTEDQEDFTMANWMKGNIIRYSNELDESSNANEAYLRTWGWNDYVSVWYLYFRKIDFPKDPNINGNWEWAGIYIGNKL